MNWDNVEMIRNAQASAKARFEATALATQEEIQKVVNSEAAKSITMPRLTELEQMIFKMRSELIDYIVAHGLVDGLIWDGVLQPIQNGKIVITKEMIEILTEHLGYFTEADVQAFLEKYLPENHYVSDADYVHTDNNYTTDEKDKLAGIETGAEVNKIIDVIFNGVSVLDDGTRVATINITPEDIKRWYEANPDTNAFTDAQKAKLAGISDGAEVNRVDDVLVNGRSVLNENKKALITKEIVKDAYESNADTNAFTDADKAKLDGIEAGAQVNKVEDVQLDGETVVNAKKQAILTGAAIKKSYEAQPDTNAFTDAEKTKLDGIEAGAQVNKVEDVQLAGTSVLDAATKTANVTAAGIKAAYESNANTNAFTDAEKTDLATLKAWKPEAETEIADNTAEIAEAKKSISELGDETNAIAGRVTTLEGSAVRDVLLNGATTVDPETHKATLTAEGIKAAYEANADTNVFTDAEKSKLEGITADAQPNKVEDVQLNGVSVLDAATKIANVTAADIKTAYESNEGINAFTDADKAKLEGITADAQPNKVEDVQLDGTSVLDASTKIANVTAAGIKTAYESNEDTNAFTDADKAKLDGIDSANFVPYTGASKNVDLGDHTISCAAPTEGTHAANKSYVDAEILTRLPAHNVKAYGAKGDGTTDDTIAIRNAVADGGIVYFPPGTYLVSATISIPKDVTIWGFGAATIKSSHANEVFNAAAAIDVSGLKIIGPGKESGMGIKISKGPASITKTSITSIKVGIWIDGSGTDGADPSKIDFCVRDCEFLTALMGADIRNATGTIDRSTFDGMESTAIVLTETDDVQIENCKFENNTIAVVVTRSSVDTKISNCVFSASSSHDIHLSGDVDRLTICGNSFVGQNDTSSAVFATANSTVKNILVTNNILVTRRVNLTNATSTVVANNIDV